MKNEKYKFLQFIQKHILKTLKTKRSKKKSINQLYDYQQKYKKSVQTKNGARLVLFT